VFLERSLILIVIKLLLVDDSQSNFLTEVMLLVIRVVFVSVFKIPSEEKVPEQVHPSEWV